MGAQLRGRFYLGENGSSYRLGNRYEGSSWISLRMNEYFSVSARVDRRPASGEKLSAIGHLPSCLDRVTRRSWRAMERQHTGPRPAREIDSTGSRPRR